MHDPKLAHGAYPHCLRVDMAGYDPEVSDLVVKRLRGMIGWPLDGEELYGFRSAKLRDEALDDIRSQFGWTSVEKYE